MTNRLGIFGGTFDPPHNGHLALATEALVQLELNLILWVLTPQPPHKPDQIITPWVDRWDMLESLIGDVPFFELSRVEIDRLGPHYAVETVKLLADQYPDAQLVYLMGEDSLRDLHTWRDPVTFVRNCHLLGILRRPDTDLSLDELEREIPGITSKLAFIDLPPAAISSSHIRQQIQLGRGCPAGLNPEVYNIIQARNLYR
ncbi:MAG: nicotinate-nucleotide adenylyltransferase [Chloroflexota bacterium]